MRVEFEFLGTGTSYGVPSIGCHCAVCTSDDPRNRRLRSSVLVRVTKKPGSPTADGQTKSFLVDCTPDFRFQALRADFCSVDAVLFTHEHADHTQGIDDLRAIYWHNGRKDIPIYAYPECMDALRRRFGYMFDKEDEYKGAAKLEEHIFEHDAFKAEGIEILPVPLVHGGMRVAAFRIGELAYTTDTNRIPAASIEALRGVRLLVIDALRRAPHPTHLSLPEALDICEELGVERACFTHINHDLDHAEVSRELPDWAELGYDTLRYSVERGGEVVRLGDRLDSQRMVV